MRLLLISNSTLHGSGYLDHAESEIRDFLDNQPHAHRVTRGAVKRGEVDRGDVKRVLFVPYALHDRDAYAAQARARLEKMGYQLDSIHTTLLIGTPRALRAREPRPTRGRLPRPDSKAVRDAEARAVREADAIFIGGGNTFRLLKALYDHDLLDVIRERVREGMPYIRSSAGSNIAAPTLRTTNDMPIVQPPSFDALGLVSFQINPHYLDADPNSTHKAETSEERIVQFLEENETPVVGLREGAMLRIENGKTLLKGSTGARIFRRGREPVEVLPGAYLDELLS